MNAILNGINYDENQAAAIRSLWSAALMTIANYNSVVMLIYKHSAGLLGILPVLSTYSWRKGLTRLCTNIKAGFLSQSPKSWNYKYMLPDPG